MTALPALAAWVSAVALGSVAVEGEVRLSGGAREVRVEAAPARSERLVEVAPRLALLRHGRLELALSYAPRLTVPFDLGPGAEGTTAPGFLDRREILNEGIAALELAATPTLTLRLGADAVYGRVDLLRSNLYTEDVITRTERIAYRALEASAGATATPTVRTTLGASARVFEAGGADASSRRLVPLRRGAAAEGRLGYALTRRDDVAATADAVYSEFTPATPVSESAYARLGGTWVRELAPALSGRVASGAAWAYEAPALAPPRRSIAPWAEVGFTHVRTHPDVRTDLGLAVSPYMSPLDGSVDQRVDATLATTWRPARTWELVGTASGSILRTETSAGLFWTGVRSSELAWASARASWAFTPNGALSFGPTARWQRSHDVATPTFVEWGATADLTLRASWPRSRPGEPGDARGERRGAGVR